MTFGWIMIEGFNSSCRYDENGFPGRDDVSWRSRATGSGDHSTSLGLIAF
jgi:hypothetical protein